MAINNLAKTMHEIAKENREPRKMDKPFIDYIKSQCRERGCNLDEMDDMEYLDAIMDCGFSNPQCPVFLLHNVTTQVAELRARLADYDDVDLLKEMEV